MHRLKSPVRGACVPKKYTMVCQNIRHPKSCCMFLYNPFYCFVKKKKSVFVYWYIVFTESLRLPSSLIVVHILFVFHVIQI